MTKTVFQRILSRGRPEELLEQLRKVPAPDEVADDVQGFEIALPVAPEDVPLLVNILEGVVEDGQ